jgi:hypothetical protein
VVLTSVPTSIAVNNVITGAIICLLGLATTYMAFFRAGGERRSSRRT